jgi:hypothetical protein
MLNKKIWIIATAVIGLMAITGLVILSGTFASASNAIDLNYMAFIPLVLNQSNALEEPSGGFYTFTPRWELGASSADPKVGSRGTLQGWYTREEFDNGTKIDLEIYIHVRSGYAGVGTGSYEIYLPDNLEPASDWFSGHANVWIAGGGTSEFDGSTKWTMRNTTKGPKLIFTFDGTEWSPTHPKRFADLKLRANIEYWLQPMGGGAQKVGSSLPPSR